MKVERHYYFSICNYNPQDLSRVGYWKWVMLDILGNNTVRFLNFGIEDSIGIFTKDS